MRRTGSCRPTPPTGTIHPEGGFSCEQPARSAVHEHRQADLFGSTHTDYPAWSKLQQLYDAEETLGKLDHDDGLPSALREIAENIRTAGEGAQERYDNMPEGLQMGDTGQRLEQRASDAESWADEIESAADTLEEKIKEIEDKAWHELDEFSHLDPEDEDFDEDEKPSDDEIEAARQGELATVYEEAIEEAQNAMPGFD